MTRPGKIVCVGRNYREHVKEMGNEVPTTPLVFYKPTTSVIASGEPIVLPAGVGRVDFEGEIGIVIGGKLTKATAGQAAAAVRGIVAVNDVSARELQKSDPQWWRAKGYDTFCPIGPAVATGLDPATLVVRTTLDGQTRQDYPVADMRFAVPRLVSRLSHDMTLEPGDVVLIGTSIGVGSMKPGSTVEVEIAGIGKLVNRVD